MLLNFIKKEVMKKCKFSTILGIFSQVSLNYLCVDYESIFTLLEKGTFYFCSENVRSFQFYLERIKLFTKIFGFNYICL
jgi:hypothetical protein